jgi:hypothetical protein
MSLSPEILQKWREILTGNEPPSRDVREDVLGPQNYRKPRPAIQKPVPVFDELDFRPSCSLTTNAPVRGQARPADDTRRAQPVRGRSTKTRQLKR